MFKWIVTIIILSSVSWTYAADFAEITTIIPMSTDEVFVENAMAYGDINGDQKTDLLLATFDSRNDDVHLNIFYGKQWDSEISTQDADVMLKSQGFTDCVYMLANKDLNGDGIHDLISVTNNVVYIYWGGQLKSLLTRGEADLTIESEDNKTFLSAAVGDVDNDSQPDLIVSAQKHGIGYVYVFYSTFLTPFADINYADLEIVGEELNDGFGKIVEVLDDFNDDGYPELLVSAPQGNERGNVYLFYRPYRGGTIYARHQTDVKFEGEDVGGLFGYDVSSAGDFDGDGVKDLAIAAPFAGKESEQGMIYIYYARTFDLLYQISVSDADSYISGENTNDFFGLGFAVLNDLTNDGISEMIVGSSWALPFRGDAIGFTEILGKLYFFEGSRLLNTVLGEWADQSLKGISGHTWYQPRIWPAGDVNGDNYTDFFVLAYQRLNDDTVKKVIKVMTVSP